MKIVLAPNAFKESLTATEAARAMRRGLKRAMPDAEFVMFPVADGGDGVAEVLRHALGGTVTRHRVTGPMGSPVEASLVRLNKVEPRTFVIEMAETSGLRRVPLVRRNPLKATTRGLGELIRIALDRGARRIVIGLGGSATVDGGAGMAQALGFRLLDARGRDLSDGGGNLRRLARIVPPEVGKALEAIEFIGLCDVKNPLLGRRGAARVFGPQKGATPAMVRHLEEGLLQLARCLRGDLKAKTADLPGSGAAGGLGAGLGGFLGAELQPGADWILANSGFEEALDGADWVVTGEGRLDAQTLEDKAPAVVARWAARRGVRTLALAGSVDPGLRRTAAGRELFASCRSIMSRPMTLEESISRAPVLIEEAAFEIGSLIRAAT